MAAVLRAPFWSPRGSIETDAKWQGAPQRSLVMSILSANPPSGGSFWSPRGLSESYGSPWFLGANLNLYGASAAANPFKRPAYRFDRADEPGWSGEPVNSAPIQILSASRFFGAGGQAPTKAWRYDHVPEPGWTSGPMGSDILIILSAGGQRPTKSWRYDYSPEPIWSWAMPQRDIALSLAPQAAAPQKLWRYDFAPDSFWQGSPQGSDAIVMLAAGGQPPQKPWRYDSVPEPFWSWAVPQRDIALSLAPQIAPPTPQWRYDHAPEPIWLGSPQSSDIIYLLSAGGKPFAKQWRADAIEGAGWQWAPGNPGILLPAPAPAPATARMWRLDAYPEPAWQAQGGRNAALLAPISPFAARAWRADAQPEAGWLGAPRINSTLLRAPPPPTLPFRNLWRPDYASDASSWAWSPEMVRATALFHSLGVYGHFYQYLRAIAEVRTSFHAYAERQTTLRGSFVMPAIGQNVTVYPGDSRTLIFSIKAPDGSNPSFINPSASFIVTSNYAGGPDLLVIEGLPLVQAPGGAWSCSVGLSSAQTLPWAPGAYEHQLRLIDTDGSELTLALGAFTVSPIRPW